VQTDCCHQAVLRPAPMALNSGLVSPVCLSSRVSCAKTSLRRLQRTQFCLGLAGVAMVGPGLRTIFRHRTNRKPRRRYLKTACAGGGEQCWRATWMRLAIHSAISGPAGFDPLSGTCLLSVVTRKVLKEPSRAFPLPFGKSHRPRGGDGLHICRMAEESGALMSSRLPQSH